MCRLTIAIPTYNRNQVLAANLGILLGQLTPRCRLLIIDNCSDIPVADTVADVLAEYPSVDVTLVRNRVNIGASPNVLRCVEMCDTEWLWILGDDDTISHDAVEMIFSAIGDHPEATFLNFSTSCGKHATAFATTGLGDFVKRMNSFGNMLFISAGVYRVNMVRSNIRFGYFSAYAHAPHFGMLLTSLKDNGVVWHLSDVLIEEHRNLPTESLWSPINLVFGVMTLLDLPIPSDVRPLLARKILEGITARRLLVGAFVCTALRDGTADALYMFDHMFYRLGYWDKSIHRRFLRSLYRLLIRFPSFGSRAINFWRNIRHFTDQKRVNKLSDPFPPKWNRF